MAKMGLTPTGRWHLLGRHACHHAEDVEFDVVRPFDEQNLTHPEWGSLGVPSDVGGPDTDWCRHCADTVDRMRRTRTAIIADVKSVVPYRDVSWTTVESAGTCQWCGKADSATRYNDALDVTVCPDCAARYNRPEIDERDPPATDRRPDMPTDPVDPVRFTRYTGGAERPADVSSPSISVGTARQRAADEHRPYIEVVIKPKYADVICDMHGTGHRLTPAAVDEIDARQTERVETADAHPEHKSTVTRSVGRTRQYVETSSLVPDEARAHADELAAIVAAPKNWQ